MLIFQTNQEISTSGNQVEESFQNTYPISFPMQFPGSPYLRPAIPMSMAFIVSRSMRNMLCFEEKYAAEKKHKKKETLKNWRVPSWQGLFARYQNQFCGFQNLAMPKLYGTSKALNIYSVKLI